MLCTVTGTKPRTHNVHSYSVCMLHTEEEGFADTEVRCVGAHPLFGPLSRRGLNSIKTVCYFTGN